VEAERLIGDQAQARMARGEQLERDPRLELAEVGAEQ